MWADIPRRQHLVISWLFLQRHHEVGKWFATHFGTNIHISLSMTSNNFGDPQTLYCFICSMTKCVIVCSTTVDISAYHVSNKLETPTYYLMNRNQTKSLRDCNLISALIVDTAFLYHCHIFQNKIV